MIDKWTLIELVKTNHSNLIRLCFRKSKLLKVKLLRRNELSRSKRLVLLSVLNVLSVPKRISATKRRVIPTSEVPSWYGPGVAQVFFTLCGMVRRI